MSGLRKFIFCGGTILLASALFVWADLPAEAWQATIISSLFGYVGGNVVSKFSKEAGTWESSHTESLSSGESSLGG